MKVVVRMYRAGITGYPQALYGLEISGFLILRMKIAVIVRAKKIRTANMT